MQFHKVLIVENEQFHFEIVKRLLNGLSITDVHHAERGEIAIRMAEEERFDLILCDYDLGGITGVEVISKVREMPAYAHTPIIIMTAETESRVAVEASEAGATLFLKKPFTGAAFKERLDMALETTEGDLVPSPGDAG